MNNPTVYITPYYNLYRRSSNREKRYKKRKRKYIYKHHPEDNFPEDEQQDGHLEIQELNDSPPPGDALLDIEKSKEDASTSSQIPTSGNRFKDVLKDIFYGMLNVIPTQFTYYRIHLLFFALASLFFGLILFAIENGSCSSGLLFVDALYLSTSAITVTGLSTNNLAQFCFASQFVLWIEMILGGLILATLPLVVVRRYYYRSVVKRVLMKSNSVSSTASVSELLAQQGLLEYQALLKIIQVVLCYFVALNLLGFFSIYLYFLSFPEVVGRDTGSSLIWLAGFHSVAAFSNAGFSIFPDSLVRFRNSTFILVTMGILTFCGHIGFPIMLRGIIKILSEIYNWSHRSQPLSDTTPLLHGNRSTLSSSHKYPEQVYHYLLKFPRKCYTHLFPPFETKLLLIIVLFLILSEFTLFLILDWDTASFHGHSTSTKFLMSFFQSISTRTAGFSVLDLAESAPAMWVLELAYMYTAAYPVAVTVRQSNVQSGAFVFPLRTSGTPPSSPSRRGIAQSLLFRDIFWLFMAFFCISMAERTKIEQDQVQFTMFKILFEIVSAYGNVGFSLGTLTAFSTQWNPFSKVVLMLVMLLGRQRGLPENIDRAVELPKQFLQMVEESDKDDRV